MLSSSLYTFIVDLANWFDFWLLLLWWWGRGKMVITEKSYAQYIERGKHLSILYISPGWMSKNWLPHPLKYSCLIYKGCKFSVWPINLFSYWPIPITTDISDFHFGRYWLWYRYCDCHIGWYRCRQIVNRTLLGPGLNRVSRNEFIHFYRIIK